MTTVGLLYPGHAAEDDFPRIEVMIDSDIRLPLFHTVTEGAPGASRPCARPAKRNAWPPGSRNCAWRGPRR